MQDFFFIFCSVSFLVLFQLLNTFLQEALNAQTATQSELEATAIRAEQLQQRTRELETESAEMELLRAQLGSKTATLERLRLQVHELEAELARLRTTVGTQQPSSTAEAKVQ